METDVTTRVVAVDPEIRFATARVMRNTGYPVSKAETGEACIQSHSDANFSLSICPECMEELYPNETEET